MAAAEPDAAKEPPDENDLLDALEDALDGAGDGDGGGDLLDALEQELEEEPAAGATAARPDLVVVPALPPEEEEKFHTEETDVRQMIQKAFACKIGKDSLKDVGRTGASSSRKPMKEDSAVAAHAVDFDILSNFLGVPVSHSTHDAEAALESKADVRPSKRRRQAAEEADASHHASGPMVAMPRDGCGACESRPMTEKVALAFNVLGLRPDATVREVEKRFRRLARTSHPDKLVNGAMPKDLALNEFRELQQAKTTVLAWLQQGLAPEDLTFDDLSEESAAKSDDGSACEVSDGDGAGLCQDAAEDGRSMSESDAEMHRNELLACGLDPTRKYGDDPDARLRARNRNAEGDAEDSDAEGFGQLALSGISAALRSSNNCIQQAAALSRHLDAAKKSDKQLCEECFERQVMPGRKQCKKCLKELGDLMREMDRSSGRLGRRVRQHRTR
eukprot:TRINITY_DN81426_c0_g1_i1.p1 TRINITY_DN81426_c0_g1~~TRINITY_DN81426_c0_g1_i1.p1  ORF type:complete len:474 (-),score=81.66 TRINITY_DN81426_c0_g1_i1:28-1365(-)